MYVTVKHFSQLYGIYYEEPYHLLFRNFLPCQIFNIKSKLPQLAPPLLEIVSLGWQCLIEINTLADAIFTTLYFLFSL